MRRTRHPRYLPLRLRCRANVEQIRQSRPDSGLGFQVKDLEGCSIFAGPVPGSSAKKGQTLDSVKSGFASLGVTEHSHVDKLGLLYM